MKKLLIFYFLLTGLVLPAHAQATYFTFDSIWSPPYICQATAFYVDVYGMRYGSSISDSTQHSFLRNDTIFVQFNFANYGGLVVSSPLHRQILVPAPPIGQYKIVAQGFVNGQLHQTITTRLSVCSAVTGVKDPVPDLGGLQVNIYPNPTSDFLIINMPGNSKEVMLTLTDATGKACLRKKEPASKDLKLNIKAFSKGVYFLKLETERGSVIKKVVKQ